ncbi:DNA polymerase III, delta subunit [Carboxydocella sporoproducens DSM 16521]|uniref:DNA polymerase III subunit delta n=2 Tax=Carboxydocella TaxID=178898 RepID=A0A1T4RV88_9FIRM|nr:MULTISPECIES: DNA polymerase III subunit delta [Carboxydocella]AVX19989.1 DNA polymerase III, delta subunit [Carboxydocella thermautotrophica]SKA19807.1 DNA polymerase III, delta subunit [Carboxydocella sporoproducens DSM 16521]
MLAADGVLQSIKRGVVSPLYFIYGEETWQIRELVRAFRELLAPALRDFNLQVLDGKNTSWEQLVNSARTIPFLAERRVVIVENWQALLAGEGGQGEEVFLSYLSDPNPATTLVLVQEGKPDKGRKAVKALEKAAQVVQCTQPKGSELLEFIRNQARQLGLRLEEEAIRELALMAGSNLPLLHQELQKLALYAQGEMLNKDQIQELVAPSPEATIFQLMDAVAEGRFTAALPLLKELLFHGEPPARILYMLTRQFRLLWQASLLAARGYGDKQIAAQINAPPFAVPKLLRQSRRFSEGDFYTIWDILLEADLALKTSRQDQQLVLELTILRLCGKK